MGILTFSLALNLVVLIPVCTGLLVRDARMTTAFGEWTPARGILLSIYLTIALASALLLAWPDPNKASVLLGLQVVYKVTTPFSVGTLRNPVVISNVLIAAVHVATLFSMGAPTVCL
ncbi:MAG: hypothetical protein RL199_813 [Pseudomonadota bacterium]